MKKILTLMAALSAVAGTAMAHDYDWTPTVGADGPVENCSGLTYGTVTGSDVYGKKFSFDADANDKITLTVSGENLGVTVNGVQLEVVITDGKMTFTATTGGLVEILLGENTVVSNIKVVSEKKTNVEKAIKKANDILDARVNNISKYVNGTSDFYTAVRTLINVEGGKLTKLTELLKEFADADLMGQPISVDKEPGYETSATIDRTNGEAYIMSLLTEIEAAIGTKVSATTEAEKGSILTNAETAYGKYKAIVDKTETNVSNANTEITKQTTAGSNSKFYKNEGTTLRPNYVEMWTADNTASKTRALDLFKTFVVQYRDTLANSALDALNKFDDQTELDALPAKFANINTRSKTLSDRYTFEETVGGLKTGVKNYDAIKTLSTEVGQLADLANRGYKNADGTALFDGETAGLTDLQKKSENLYNKVSDTKNKHLIANPETAFKSGTDGYDAVSNSIDAVKITWGTTAKNVLEAKLTEVQDSLTKYENIITTKYQNNAEKLAECQKEFAKLQVRLNNVKKSVADVTTVDKAYGVAIKYHDNDVELDNVRDSINGLWYNTQTAENQAIIAANDKAYTDLENVANDLDGFANDAVARLVKFREAQFFKDVHSNDYEDFKTGINRSIKTIYDYAAAIKKAKEDAFSTKDACNKPAEGAVKSALADLTAYMEVINTDKTAIETALNGSLDVVNNDVYAYFMTSSYNGYNGYVNYVKESINGSNFYGGYDYNSSRTIGSVIREIEYKANNTVAVKDNTADAACVDAKDLANKAVYGTFDANGQLVEANNDIANAIVKITTLKAENKLADDVVGDNTVKAILTAAQTAAGNAKSQFDAYADEKTELYNLMVKWSENQAKVATATNADAVKMALADLRSVISTLDDTLTKVDKLNFDEAKYAEKVKTFKATLSYTTDANTFASYTNVKDAKEAAEKQIADAKTALAELTKESAKAGLQAAINVAEGTVTTANRTLETCLTDYTFAEKAEALLKDYKSVDLTQAIKDAQEDDKKTLADYDGNGTVDIIDVTTAGEHLYNGVIDGDVYSNFIDAYLKYKSGKK